MFNGKQIFGLRKLSVGLTSVVLGLSFAGIGAHNVQAAEPASTPAEQTEQTPQPEQKKTDPVSSVQPTRTAENGPKAEPASQPDEVYKGKFIDAPEYSGESDQQRNKFNEIAQKWDQEIANVVEKYYQNQGISENSNARHKYMVFGRYEKISGSAPDNQLINVARKYDNMRSYVMVPAINHADGKVDMPIGETFGDASRFEFGTMDSSGRFIAGTFDAAGHFVSGTNRVSTGNWKIITPAIIVNSDGHTDKPTDSSSLIYSIRKTKLTKAEFKDTLDQMHDYFPAYNIPQVDGYDSYYQIAGQDRLKAKTVPALLANKPYDITITYVQKPSTNPDKPAKTIPWTPLTPATPIHNTDPTPDPQPEPQPTPEIPETPDHPEKPATSDKPVVEEPANKPAVHRTAKSTARRQTVIRSCKGIARITSTSYRTNYRQVSQPVNHTARRTASLPQTGNKSYAALGAVVLCAAVGLLGLADLRKRRN